MCNTNECEDIYSDPREEQCHALDPRFEIYSNKHHWLPYEHTDRECTPRRWRRDDVVCWRDGNKKRLSKIREPENEKMK